MGVHADWLAGTYLNFRQMENALRVELWRSISNLPANSKAPEWETMRRHAAICSPKQLAGVMKQVRTCFEQLFHIME